MSEEELEWLIDIATPTGISYSGDQTITIDFAIKVINYINKQKEVLDKIKDKIKIKIAREFNEDDYMINADDLIEIKELLEEIE